MYEPDTGKKKHYKCNDGIGWSMTVITEGFERISVVRHYSLGALTMVVQMCRK